MGMRSVGSMLVVGLALAGCGGGGSRIGSAVSAGISINGGTVTFADVSPTSPPCATTAGVRTCTIGGLLLSSGSNTTTVVAGTPFTVGTASSTVV